MTRRLVVRIFRSSWKSMGVFHNRQDFQALKLFR